MQGKDFFFGFDEYKKYQSIKNDVILERKGICNAAYHELFINL